MTGMGQNIRLCRNGHIKKKGTIPELAERWDIELSRENNVGMGSSYCQECGSEVIHRCEECEYAISVGSNWSAEFDDLPQFCKECGDAFPWASPIDANEEREGRFIDIDDTEVNGQFYPSLVYEINLCYRVKADEACVVLARKLVENLLIDILKRHFGMAEIDLFYNTEHKRHRGLGTLIKEFSEHSEEFDQYTTARQSDIIESMKSIKYSGDASAHSIEEDFNQEDLARLSEEATRAAELLFRLKRETEVSHRK